MGEIEYSEALKLGKKEYRTRIAKGQFPYLPVLDEILSEADIQTEQNMGLVSVPLNYVMNKLWAFKEEADRKKAIVDELKEVDVLVEAVREKNPALANADIFDIICHVAYDQPALTRRERANNVKKRNYFAKYEGKAREVLEALLEKYAEYGILNFEDVNVLDHSPFDTIGKPQRIMKLFGGVANFEKAIRELETEIYKNIA